MLLLWLPAVLARRCTSPTALAGCSSLDLSCTDANGTKCTLPDAEALAAALKASEASELTQLELRGNTIGLRGLVPVAAAIGLHGRLHTLGLSSCGLGDSGLQLLLSGLINSPSLRKLELRDNLITDEGARQLGLMLKSNKPALAELDVSWNGVGLKAARALSDALRNNTELEALELSWNGLKDKGARAIGEALPHNRKLRELGLEHNAIKDSGAKGLAAGLRANSGLRVVRLEANGLSADSHRSVEAALKAQPVEKESKPAKDPPPPPRPTPPSDEDEDLEEISLDDEEPSHDEL